MHTAIPGRPVQRDPCEAHPRVPTPSPSGRRSTRVTVTAPGPVALPLCCAAGSGVDRPRQAGVGERPRGDAQDKPPRACMGPRAVAWVIARVHQQRSAQCAGRKEARRWPRRGTFLVAIPRR